MWGRLTTKLAQRNSPHNKGMKWGPLLRFLQNLPELHPHPLLITAVPCLMLIALNCGSGCSANLHMTSETSFFSKLVWPFRENEKIPQQPCYIWFHILPPLLCLECAGSDMHCYKIWQKHNLACLPLSCIKAKSWPTFLFWLQNTSKLYAMSVMLDSLHPFFCVY